MILRQPTPLANVEAMHRRSAMAHDAMTRRLAVLFCREVSRMSGRTASLRSLCAAAAFALLASGPAAAGDRLSGEQIRAAVAGNTVQGTMEGTGAYAEFYQPDGIIKGDGYTGTWKIDGDSMCFQYGSDPKSCWEVTKEGSAIQWIKDGKVEGTGTVEPGNPNNY